MSELAAPPTKSVEGTETHPDAALPGARRLPFLDLVNGVHCKWPHGHPKRPGFFFCAADVETPGKPYCAAHNRMAWSRKEPLETTEARAVVRAAS